ncbi:hypothetical protein FNF28_00522 [Cafeteria roenbergensis]|nr:hypothetical protein FNF28_00522 [Cafeteria roenbergensis]
MLVGKEGQRAALGEAPAAQLALEAVTQRVGGTSVGVLSGLVRGLFRAGRDEAEPRKRAMLLGEAIQAAGADGLGALPSMLRLVMQAQGGAWRGTAVRYLTAVDNDMLDPEQVTAHVSGDDVDEVRVALPGELGSAVSGFFSREELITLLRDLLDFLGGDALGSCVGAMVDPRGPLHAPTREDLDRRERVGLLKLLLSAASVDEVREAMPPGMLAALGAEGGDGGAAAAAADVAKRVRANKAASAEEAARTAALPAEVRSMLRYTRKPPRGLRDKTRLKAERAASLVYEVWAAKAREDTFDDSRGETRQPLGAYTRDYLLQKLGLASLADGALYGLVGAMRKSGEGNVRLQRFGTMMGVLEPESFSPRRADVFLLLCKLCFTRFTDKTFKNRPLGTCFVLADTAASALSALFPATDTRLPASTERIGLEPDLRSALLADVAEKTITYGDFVAEHSGGGPPSPEPAAGHGSRHSRPAAAPHRGLRGGPDFALTAQAVDFDWLAERALKAWADQRERDARSMKWLFERHDADGNGVLSLAEFSTLLKDCLSGADGDGGVTAGGSFSSTSSAEAGGEARLPRGRSGRDLQEGSAGPGGLGRRRVLKLFEEVMRLSRQAARARHGGKGKRSGGAGDDEDDEDDDGEDLDAALPESFAALCDSHGILPPPYARRESRLASAEDAGPAAALPRSSSRLLAGPRERSQLSSFRRSPGAGSRQDVARQVPRLPSSRLARAGASVGGAAESDSGSGRLSVASSRHSDASEVEAFGVADVTE